MVGGQASIANLKSETLIKQLSNKAIINWNGYSVQRGESVIYQQPGASSIALNRVLGGQPSSILGHIGANGQVWLINPNGVLFGRGATVNAAGVLATTADIANSDFMAGNYNFGTPSSNPNAGIVNFGSVTAATGGSVVLAAPTVDNEGLIQARLGTIAVGAGKTFAVDFNGDNLLNFAVTTPATNAQIKNGGTLSADGGSIQITARAAGNIVDNVINTTGIVEANSVSIHNGTVVLDAGGAGVTVAGKVSAAGTASGTVGGTVQVTGGSVNLASTASIDVSGKIGGGTALIGGNFHGAGPLANAATTTIAQGAVIDADAIAVGNGGRVAVWSSKQTVFNGSISARGGKNGGNGGFVETSSQGALAVGGFVNTLAPNGVVGNWLLDPDNINVVASGGSASLWAVGSFSNDQGQTDSINASTIDSAASNVTLQAKNTIDFQAPISMTNNGVGLTAQADTIKLETGAGITTKGGAILLAADAAGSNQSGSGTLQLGADLASNGGTIALNGPTLLTNNVGIVTTAAGTGGANVDFNGTLDDSVAFQHSLSVTAGTGNVGFHGRVGIDNASIGVDPGAVTIVSAQDVTMDMPFGDNGDGFAAKSLSVTANGAFTVTKGYISTFNPGGSGGDVFINTGGAVSIDGNIEASAGASGGNGGTVNITAGGAVSIFGCCGLSQFGTTGIGTNQVANIVGINTQGYSIASAAETPGNGGVISVTGTSINLPFGATSHGGEAVASGATINGGNGADITLTATAGGVAIGNPVNNGNLTGLYAQGGNATGGTGGHGGNVTITGQTISLTNVISAGGNSEASSGGTGNFGGDITLIATATSGAAVTLFGEADSVENNLPALVTLASVGGRFGSSGSTPLLVNGGPFHGAAGNITIEGSAGGAPLAGTSFVQLATGTNTGFEGGSSFLITASGGTGAGGTVAIKGPIEGTTANVESLRIDVANGQATVAGAVGDLVPLHELVLGCCGVDESGNANPNGLLIGGTGGAFTFNHAVSVNTVLGDIMTGSETFNGLVTTTHFAQPDGNDSTPANTDLTAIALLGGADFSGTLDFGKGALTIGGYFTFASSFTDNLNFKRNATLGGDTTLDVAALNGPLTLSGTIDGATAGGQSLTLLAGTGSITVTNTGSIGATTPLGGLTLSACTITAAGTVNVGNFVLQRGAWSQVNATLPSFQATNFELQGGTFLRALGGNGTSGYPYQLADVYGLQGVGTLLSSNFSLANDINAGGTSAWNSGAGFIPIGGAAAFTGTFDGKNHAINGLTIVSSGASVGLFGTNSGTISNLALVDAHVLSAGSDASAGVLAGTNTGTITNSSAAGFLVGTADSGGNANLGGLVGYNNGGTINGGSFAAVAVADNANYGDDSLGGLVGRNNGTLFQTDAIGAVVGSSNDAVFNGWGGLVGVQDGGSISQSFASASVTNLSSAEPNIGGLVGIQNGGTIADSFASGPVMTLSANGGIYIGGLVGWQTAGSIARSYSVGLVQCPDNGCSQGGLIGVRDAGTVDGLSFWDTQTSGQSTSAGGIGLTTAQAQSASFLTNVGWSFSGESPWRIADGVSYPFLAWVGHGPTLTEIVSGTAPAGAVVDLLINGLPFAPTVAAPNGAYDFILPANTAGDVLVYLPGGSSNVVSPLTASGAAGLGLTTANAVTLLSQGGTIETSFLATALGSTTGPGILYRANNNVILLNTNVALNVLGGSNAVVNDAIMASAPVLVAASHLDIGANIGATGFVTNAPVRFLNSATVNGGTGGVIFGSTVDTGANDVTIVGDTITLGGPWSGIGARTLYPFTAGSAVTLAPTIVAPAPFNLTATELADLDGGSPSLVTIGSATAPATGSLTTGDFIFESPLRLIGRSITFDPLTKDTGRLTAISSGPVDGGINLGAGSGDLFLTAFSAALTGTVDGFSGADAAQHIILVPPDGPGPFTMNGVAIGQVSPPSPPQNPPSNTRPDFAQTVTQINNAQTIQNNQFQNPFNPFALFNNRGPDANFNDQISEALSGELGLDSGASMFGTISPNTPADLTASSGASGTDAILLAAANPPPVKPAAYAEPTKPQVTHPIAPYLNQMLMPSVPRNGVPGISFGYSLTGNSALW